MGFLLAVPFITIGISVIAIIIPFVIISLLNSIRKELRLLNDAHYKAKHDEINKKLATNKEVWK